MGAIAVALGIAVLFNFIILRIKWNRGEYSNVGVDLGMLLLLNIFFGGSILGVVSATFGSTLISLYLMKYPITLLDFEHDSSTTEAGGSSTKAKQDTSKPKWANKIDSLFD